MTTNQMILLLQVYRGSHKVENHPGTHEDDKRYLLKYGYLMLVGADQGLDCTPLARAWIRDRVLKEAP